MSRQPLCVRLGVVVVVVGLLVGGKARVRLDGVAWVCDGMQGSQAVSQSVPLQIKSRLTDTRRYDSRDRINVFRSMLPLQPPFNIVAAPYSIFHFLTSPIFCAGATASLPLSLAPSPRRPTSTILVHIPLS